MLPSATNWAMIRKALRQVMQDTISIYNISITRNGEGYESKVRTLAISSIAQLSAPSGNERRLIQALVDGGAENIETIKLTLPYNTSIAINQEVDTADAKTWNVIHTTTTQTYNGATEALLYRRVVNDRVVN